jgi:DNA replicative helicase MCM subunit Mcm2 (Cdc46/Mcm family)
MTTILSRFDMIFLVRDTRDEERDRSICQHVMGVHINNSRGSDGGLGHVAGGGGDVNNALNSYMTNGSQSGGDLQER